ncbi:MAG TPA: M48 family metalloprotease [Candidatus Acidoferrales bacterium]|nr:M48 family metalloprotease [Candidatus Acidoferrales bacterium]
MLVKALHRPAVITVAIICLPAFALGADSIPQQQMQWEMQAGQQEYAQMMQRGEIVAQSPLYASLEPVAQRVAAVADPQYFAPFRFILVNERSPNAMATPGGNVYVTVPMLQFAQNQDELAGVLCHEVSHDIHHDVYNNNRKVQGLTLAGSLLGAFMGPYNYLGQAAVAGGAGMQALSYSRKDESNADHTGAYICAQAGFNPWGMVWLFQRYAQLPAQTHGAGSMEAFSDHPHDDHRITDLENLFRSDTATFGKFVDNPSAAQPLPSPAPMQAYQGGGNYQTGPGGTYRGGPYQGGPYQGGPYQGGPYQGGSPPGQSQPTVPMPQWTPAPSQSQPQPPQPPSQQGSAPSPPK